MCVLTCVCEVKLNCSVACMQALVATNIIINNKQT